MRRSILLLAATTIAAAAPARGAIAQGTPDRPPAPAAPATPAVDPVGTYDLGVVIQGASMPATVRIEKKPDATLGGSVSTDAYGTFEIASVKVSGKTVTIVIYTQDGSPVTIGLTLEGDQVTGEWYMSSDGSKVTGKKRPPAP
jgi:FAD/FMN-containing dehydrogenase